MRDTQMEKTMQEIAEERLKREKLITTWTALMTVAVQVALGPLLWCSAAALGAWIATRFWAMSTSAFLGWCGVDLTAQQFAVGVAFVGAVSAPIARLLLKRESEPTQRKAT